MFYIFSMSKAFLCQKTILLVLPVALKARLAAYFFLKFQKFPKLFLRKCKSTKWDLLSLVGFPSFACKVVVPRRAFLSLLLELCYSVHELHRSVYLDKNIKEDFAIFFEEITLLGAIIAHKSTLHWALASLHVSFKI